MITQAKLGRRAHPHSTVVPVLPWSVWDSVWRLYHLDLTSLFLMDIWVVTSLFTVINNATVKILVSLCISGSDS